MVGYFPSDGDRSWSPSLRTIPLLLTGKGGIAAHGWMTSSQSIHDGVNYILLSPTDSVMIYDEDLLYIILWLCFSLLPSQFYISSNCLFSTSHCLITGLKSVNWGLPHLRIRKVRNQASYVHRAL